ncbi:MAG: hypothetical protein NVS3B14_16460 [Ktedonobacteraceae bacterium]
MQRPARTTSGAFTVKRAGDFETLRIDLDDRFQRWAMPVNRLDTLKVQLDESFCAKLPGAHSCL